MNIKYMFMEYLHLFYIVLTIIIDVAGVSKSKTW